MVQCLDSWLPVRNNAHHTRSRQVISLSVPDPPPVLRDTCPFKKNLKRKKEKLLSARTCCRTNRGPHPAPALLLPTAIARRTQSRASPENPAPCVVGEPCRGCRRRTSSRASPEKPIDAVSSPQCSTSPPCMPDIGPPPAMAVLGKHRRGVACVAAAPSTFAAHPAPPLAWPLPFAATPPPTW
jgi:hypothetical protein